MSDLMMSPQILDQNSIHETTPSKRYFTIGEVSEACAVKPHVLRYWEQEFPQLKPSKRRGNRRYYKYKDILLIKRIYELLYEKGYTISGARQWIAQSNNKDHTDTHTNFSTKIASNVVQDTIYELEGILKILDN